LEVEIARSQFESSMGKVNETPILNSKLDLVAYTSDPSYMGVGRRIKDLGVWLKWQSKYLQKNITVVICITY
jgi:hypothetical protein